MNNKKNRSRPRESRRRQSIKPKNVGETFFNVGFVHKLLDETEQRLDLSIMENLELGPFEPAPYTAKMPRHITSVLPVVLDKKSISFLDLGLKLGRMGQADDDELMEFVGSKIASSAVEVQSNRVKQLACSIVDIFPISGGLGVAASVDCSYVSEVRSVVSKTLQDVGVQVPDMREPHLALALASDRYTAKKLYSACSSLVGMEINYGRVEPYYNRYTAESVPMVYEPLFGELKVVYDDAIKSEL